MVSSPKAPTPPDPVATAQAQGQVNKDTAVAQANLNRIDQYTPQGSSTYSQVGTNADGTPQYRQDTTYSPEQQKLYDQQNQIAQALGGLGMDNIGRVQATQSQSWQDNIAGATPLTTSVGGGLPAINSGGAAPTLNSNYGTVSGAGRGIQRAVDTNGVNPVQQNIDTSKVTPTASTTGIQSGLDYTNLTALPGTDDFGAEAKRAQDAAYGQATSRLDPQFQQAESDARAKLANSGISENSDAYRRELDNMMRAKTDAYGAATNASIQAGANEQSRLFGLSLAARQQGQNETNTQGNFVNNAQNQQFNQDYTNRGQSYGEASNNMTQNNNAQGQLFGQKVTQGQFVNDAQGQGFDQSVQQTAANNAALSASNDTKAQQFNLSQSAAAFGNQARTQGFNEQGANASLNNSSRQQQIAEAAYARNLPINDIAALLGTGGGVQNPTFGAVPQVGVNATDYSGLVNNQYNAQMNQYNQAQASRSALLGSVFGLAGTAAMASDRRLKYDIKPVGFYASGIPTFSFKYKGSTETQFGVMAQDVIKVFPEAVHTGEDGFMFVDYRKVA